MAQREHEAVAAKERIRRDLLRRRAAVEAAGWSAAATAVEARVVSLPELRGPTGVLAYAATPREVPTAALVDSLIAAGHAVAVPVLTGGRSMRGRRVGAGGIHGLPRERLGVPTPPAAAADDEDAWLDRPAVVLLPGVAFDPATGARLGRGGGFYDAWLKQNPGVLAVGLCLDLQLVADLPSEPHDRAVGVLVTPTRTLRF